VAGEGVTVVQTGAGEYAAEVHEAGTTTRYSVLFPRALLEELDVPEPDEERFVVESVRYLLERIPVTALPREIDLEGIQREDAEFLPDIRERLTVR
jgi:hypothetical protein